MMFQGVFNNSHNSRKMIVRKNICIMRIDFFWLSLFGWLSKNGIFLPRGETFKKRKEKVWVPSYSCGYQLPQSTLKDHHSHHCFCYTILLVLSHQSQGSLDKLSRNLHHISVVWGLPWEIEWVIFSSLRDLEDALGTGKACLCSVGKAHRCGVPSLYRKQGL